MEDIFDGLDSAFKTGGAAAAFDTLLERLKAQGQHAHCFEARLMQKRHELGLPLNGDTASIPSELRAEWDAHVAAEARLAGETYLAEGEIARAWPYFRALGDPGPVREAIDNLPAADAKDEIIDVALYERVHPARGYAMVLATHGSCRAITCLDQYPDPESRDAALELLTGALHAELTENLARVLEKQDGAPPTDRSMTAPRNH